MSRGVHPRDRDGLAVVVPPWRGTLAGAAVAFAVAAASMLGCSPESRYGMLTFLFGDVPQEREGGAADFVRSPRRAQPTPTPTPTSAPAGRRQPTFANWDDASRHLPKDLSGNPDWMGAIEQRIIEPRPGLAGAGETEVLDLDVEFAGRTNPGLRVVFSHRKHGTWLACRNCHEGLFEMKRGSTPGAASLHDERYCGACHGKVAFEVANGCPLCHLRALPRDDNGSVDWNRALAAKLIDPAPARPGRPTQPEKVLDLDVEMTPPGQPNLKGVFSHASHTQWLACANCHPRPFAMQAGQASASHADLHSREYCGSCHGAVAFGIIRGCERCHPALEKGKQHQNVLDLDVTVPSKTDQTATTVFSHRIHTPWVECSSCHTDFFEKSAAAKSMSMSDLYSGTYCAVCHGKVDDLLNRCRPCHSTAEPK